MLLLAFLKSEKEVCLVIGDSGLSLTNCNKSAQIGNDFMQNKNDFTHFIFFLVLAPINRQIAAGFRSINGRNIHV